MSNMNVIWPEPGRYILAVSGGADSMVLLDLLAGAVSERGYELVVAHFDHGLRLDSHLDAQFVAAAAARYGLPCETAAARLGRASEATARAARHSWLEQVRVQRAAAAVLTAHHQDDLLETSLLNLARGSGRRGLAPMPTGGPIGRPLLALSRADLRAYAASHDVTWREDPTNADHTNARNLLRHRLLPAASQQWRESYLALVTELHTINETIDLSISIILKTARTDDQTFSFERSSFQKLSSSEAAEILLAGARGLCPGLELSRPLIAQAVNIALTGSTGQRRPLRQGVVLQIVPGLVQLTTKTPH